MLVCLAACGQVAAPPTVISPSAATDVDAILPAYTGWSRLTDEPRNVSGYIWSLCRLPLPEEEAFVESQHGGFYLSLYANQTAYPVIMQETDRVFPVGSIIVKEKLASPETTLPVALGIMVKHQPGFNTPSGDWEYLYRTSDGTLFSGIEQTQPCQSCHITQTGGDSVYYPYSILGRG